MKTQLNTQEIKFIEEKNELDKSLANQKSKVEYLE
jgi:hypothetical protein